LDKLILNLFMLLADEVKLPLKLLRNSGTQFLVQLWLLFILSLQVIDLIAERLVRNLKLVVLLAVLLELVVKQIRFLSNRALETE